MLIGDSIERKVSKTIYKLNDFMFDIVFEGNICNLLGDKVWVIIHTPVDASTKLDLRVNRNR